jgi:hypothetical protein
MSDQTGVLEATGAFIAKWLPAIAGSALSLRFVPAGSSRWHAGGALIGGFVAAVYAGPAIAEVVTATAKVEAAIVFTCGLFGLAAIGQMWLALGELQAASIVRDLIRKWFGLGGQ